MRPSDLDLPENMQNELESYHDEYSDFWGELLQTGVDVWQQGRPEDIAEIKAECGGKPLFRGKKMDAWNRCVSRYRQRMQEYELTLSQTQLEQQRLASASQKSGVHPAVWIVGGLALVGGIVATVLIVRKKKRA